MEKPIRLLGMAWYSLEHYAQIKATMEDAHLLPAVYSSWRMQAEQAERKFRREGYTVVRAHLVPDAFREHCLRHGLNLNAEGRTHFASWIAKQQHRDTQ